MLAILTDLFYKKTIQMYTEICHYFLLYITLSAILWSTSLSLLVFFNNNKKTNKIAFTKKKLKRKKHSKEKYITLWFDKWKVNFWMYPYGTKILFSSFFLFLSFSFFGTINNYICSDFSIYNTTTNSTADIPLFYKISATWSNHEGSLLLWSWLLSLSAFFFSMTLQFSKINFFSKLTFYFLKKHSLLEPHFVSKNYLIRKSFSPDVLLHVTNHQSSDLINPIRFAFLTEPILSEPIYKLSGYSITSKERKLHSNLEKKIYNLKKLFNLTWKKIFHCTSTIALDKTSKNLDSIRTKATFVIKAIVIFFTTFCIVTSNPFLRIPTGPSINSLAELNPILQDPILAIHPPCIYIGYVASGIAFSLCVGILPDLHMRLQKIRKSN